MFWFPFMFRKFSARMVRITTQRLTLTRAQTSNFDFSVERGFLLQISLLRMLMPAITDTRNTVQRKTNKICKPKNPINRLQRLGHSSKFRHFYLLHVYKQINYSGIPGNRILEPDWSASILHLSITQLDNCVIIITKRIVWSRFDADFIEFWWARLVGRWEYEMEKIALIRAATFAPNDIQFNWKCVGKFITQVSIIHYWQYVCVIYICRKCHAIEPGPCDAWNVKRNYEAAEISSEIKSFAIL